MRVLVKVVVVLVLSGAAVAAGHRLATGRLPRPVPFLAMTAGLFLAIVAADAAIGW